MEFLVELTNFEEILFCGSVNKKSFVFSEKTFKWEIFDTI